MSEKIVVAGSSNTDMVVKVPKIPVPGETVLGNEFLTIHGGKGANQAVSAARAGSDVTFVACVAEDDFGRKSIDNYVKENINTSYIKKVTNTHSGIALINVDSKGENSISVAPGANSYLMPEDIESIEEVFDDAKVILAQLEIPIITIEKIAEIAEKKNIPFLLNPAPAFNLPDDLLRKISILTPNQSEAQVLSGSTENVTAANAPDIAAFLYDKGIEIVILTLGSEGVYVHSEEFVGQIGGYKVNPVDTTAAGDVFNGALVSGLASRFNVIEAVDFAQRAAAISVTRMGAQPSAPWKNEIKELNLEK
jgi:ribokinase